MDKRLEQLKFVVDSSEHVKIHQDMIEEYVQLLDLSHGFYWLHQE